MSKPVNALSWLYKKAQEERDVSLIQIYNLVNKHFKYERTKQLEHFCKITNKVAIHSLKMTEHQRKKHRFQWYNLNGKTYYLFDRLGAWVVGVNPERDVYIYE